VTTDATKPYNNNASQAERAETLENDRRVQRDTFHTRANAELDLENSGRFSKPHAVIGLDSVEYPTLPENSWTNDPTPTEPPLGIDVNAMEPVGESFEVAASLEALGDATTEAECVGPQSAASPLAAVAVPLEVHASPADVERTAASPHQ
jgi:hypothetical protein